MEKSARDHMRMFGKMAVAEGGMADVTSMLYRALSWSHRLEASEKGRGSGGILSYAYMKCVSCSCGDCGPCWSLLRLDVPFCFYSARYVAALIILPLFIFLLYTLFVFMQHYDLPDKATSWRCASCSTFNSITPGECEWCTIL